MSTDTDRVVERIRRANEGRDPERLRRKIEAMREDPFAFFRGTCHLFADDWPRGSDLDRAPSVWICGDLHLENFGTFKGDNRLEYFDLNDFDEAVLAPCTRDVARLATSIFVAAHRLRLERSQAAELCRDFLAAYARALQEGKARWIERETATGIVKALMKALRFRKRKMLLRKKTIFEDGRRRIRVDGERALPASTAERRKVKRALAEFAASRSDRRFFRVIDVARRIAGTGSLGVERYVVLVEGNGSPHKNYLLDLKKALPSVWHPPVPQRKWPSEADRVVFVQKRVQAISPALLGVIHVDSTAFVLRELQPVEDRLSLEHWNGKLARLSGALTTMGELTAWAELRAGCSSEALVEFGGRLDWRRAVFDYASSYASRVRRDWDGFRRAARAGAFSV
jgi:uncharacterized protein (DUF2252 family)